MHKKKVSLLEIYQLAIGIHPSCGGYQFSSTQIADYLGVSKQDISKHIKKMIYQGYLICDNPDGNPKFYSATFKTYNEEKTKSGCRPEIILQKARYEVIIEREYSNFFMDKKQWMWHNCPCFQYTSCVFDDFPEFIFTKVGSSKVIVTVPGMPFKKGELSIAKHTLYWVASESLKWFSKTAKIRFDWTTLHLCQKPHIVRPAKSPWAKRVTRDWSLNIDGMMLDNSSGNGEWECTVFDDDVVTAVDALENWDCFTDIQREIKGFQNRIDYFENNLLPALQQSIDNILKETLNVKKILTTPSKPDDLDNPSYG